MIKLSRGEKPEELKNDVCEELKKYMLKRNICIEQSKHSYDQYKMGEFYDQF